MSAYEQHVEQPDRSWQYLLVSVTAAVVGAILLLEPLLPCALFPPPDPLRFCLRFLEHNADHCTRVPAQIAAEPYQTISFKIQAREIDSAEGMSWSHFDTDTKTLSFQFMFAQPKQ